MLHFLNKQTNKSSLPSIKLYKPPKGFASKYNACTDAQ